MRLLIGDVIERDDHPVIKKTSLVRVPIRLGEDVFDTGSIGNAKRDYLIKSLKAFRLLTDVYGINYVRCCATSAVREAANRAEIIAQVEMQSGVHIEVIDGKIEADLIYSTFWTQDLLKDRNYLYIDVGGGSTELTWLEKGHRIKAASFRIGTVRTLKGKVSESEWSAVRAFLEDLREEHGQLMAIGTGGNINRIFKENGNRFGEPLLRTDIRKQRDRIAAYSFDDRVKVLRLRPDRADVIDPRRGHLPAHPHRCGDRGGVRAQGGPGGRHRLRPVHEAVRSRPLPPPHRAPGLTPRSGAPSTLGGHCRTSRRWHTRNCSAPFPRERRRTG
ncbi:MAG: exopolyphosphatase [Flavobacteriales bacterium]